jgi:protein-disulfide isomerase-like protein with CxxC motif
VSAWTEAVLARIEASSAQEQVASQAEEVQQRRLELGQAVSRAEVLGGQLAEATEQLAGVSARAGALAESLAVRAQVQCWRPPSRWRSFRLCRRLRLGQVPPRVETSPRVLLLPLLMSEPAGTVCL